jgi:hypothetical protein
MQSGVTVLVADAQRLALLRDGLPLPGRVLRFSTSNLASAFDSIRTHRPALVALDAVFASTPEGHAFADRVERLRLPHVGMQLVGLTQGVWTLTPMRPEPAALVDPPQAGLNTRRAPRFPVLDPLEAVIEGHPTSVVNISALGAQVVSEPVLRPNQRIKVRLPDLGETLRLAAHIAWSVYEKPKPAREPHYRAGLEFDGTLAQLLEDYCRRHFEDAPLPSQSG